LGTNQFDGRDDGSLLLNATTTIVHEQFNSSTFNNDIALIQLPKPVNFTSEYCTQLQHCNGINTQQLLWLML
jgi:hypothetical protein